MRQAMRDSGSPTTRSKTLPAPVGGWNTLDSIADMSANDAVFLDNFFPRTTDLVMRKGAKNFALLPEGKEIRTVMGYKSVDGSAKMFAGAQDGVYDISNGGTILTPMIPATSGEWQYVNTTSPGGNFIFACNGKDSSMVYDGLGWSRNADANGFKITNVDPTKIANVSSFKGRLILCVNGSMSFWYLPVNQLGGAAQEFALNNVFRKGGYLVATDSWTIDSGLGPDDYFVAISSEGELAMYKGTDPSNASSFSLAGVFQLAKPMSRRCFQKMASDTLVLTQQAIYPLSKTLSVSNTDKRISLARKIERVWLDATANQGSLYGWQPTLFPEASMLLINVPLLNYPARNTIYSQQFVMNIMTGAWCRFTGWNAETMMSFNGRLFFAVHNKVSEAWTGQNDFGGQISAQAKTAFSALGTSRPKQIVMTRPVLTAPSNIDLQLGIDVDFSDNSLYSSTNSYQQVLTRWDSAVWNQSVWNGNSATLAKWRTIAAKIGRYAAIRLRVTSKDVSMTWIATDLLIADAGGELL